jgi:phospho-N-acetylmuramoyl-pentapeptide-transferase
MGEILIGGTAALLICIFLSPKFIEFLRRREFGQHIRDDGPPGHLGKAGTPTMGGIIVLIAVVTPFAILSNWDDWRAIGVFGVMIACGLIGFVDDYMKIVKRRSLGLRARTKLVLLAAVSIGLWLLVKEETHLPSALDLRFVDGHIDLGAFYPVLIYLVVAGTTSGVNLTDGLDGLAGGCAAIVVLTYIAITAVSGAHQLELLAACAVGAAIGFLWFNAFPATIFMGDTGSFGLGGAIAGLAVMTRTEVLLILIGGIFVLVAASVLIQIIAFQVFHKRVFLMAPIQHHFELKGWSETKIILRFWIIATVGAAIGFTIYSHSIKGPPT